MEEGAAWTTLDGTKWTHANAPAAPSAMPNTNTAHVPFVILAIRRLPKRIRISMVIVGGNGLCWLGDDLGIERHEVPDGQGHRMTRHHITTPIPPFSKLSRSNCIPQKLCRKIGAHQKMRVEAEMQTQVFLQRQRP